MKAYPGLVVWYQEPGFSPPGAPPDSKGAIVAALNNAEGTSANLCVINKDGTTKPLTSVDFSAVPAHGRRYFISPPV